MGNKKNKGGNQQHQSMSFESMVHKAVLAKLGPDINALVTDKIKRLGSTLAMQSAESFEDLYKRVRNLEQIMIDKLGFTAESLANQIADIEDKAEGLTRVDTVELGDIVRLEIKTKAKTDAEFQGDSKIQLRDAGSGGTLGPELEAPIVGMKELETKQIEFGEGKEMLAEVFVHRIARKPKEVKNEPASPA